MKSDFADAVAARLDQAPDLLAMLQISAQAQPGKAAVTFHSGPNDPAPQVVTYGELLNDVQALAGGLKAAGLGPDEAVAILAPALPQTLTALIAASAVGVAFAINLLLSADAIASQLALAKARIVIVLGPHPVIDIRQRLNEALAKTAGVDLVIEIPGDAPFSPRPGVASWDEFIKNGQPLGKALGPRDRVAALFHTGGTSGNPKLAELSARNLAAGAQMSAAALHWTAGDTVYVGLPLFHVGGAITCAFGALSAGVSVVFCGVMGPRDPQVIQNIWRFVGKIGASVMVLVPTSLSVAVEAGMDGADLSRLRTIMTGSTSMPSDLAARLEAKTGKPVAQVFGMTELSGICTAQPCDGVFRAPSVGWPAPLLDLRIENAAENGVGDVVMGGPNLFLGYRTEDGRGDEPVGRRVASGDLGRLDREELHLSGRRKDVIIRGGHNIDPLMIEEAACAHPDVLQAAAVAMPDAYAGELPILYVSLKLGAQARPEDLQAHLSRKITERPACPKRTIILTALPVTPVGKIAKYKLKQMAAELAVREALNGYPIGSVVCSDVSAKTIILEAPSLDLKEREKIRTILNAMCLTATFDGH